MSYKQYKEWDRENYSEVGKGNCCDCCCHCDCDCGYHCDYDREKSCSCKKEEKKEYTKEKYCPEGKLVLVFNTCIDGDVSISESFRDNLRDNFSNNTESFRDNFKDNFRDALRDNLIIKDILSHNAIEILSRNCVDLMIDSAREFLNENLKNALNESFNDIDKNRDNVNVEDILNHNLSCNKVPVANQVSNSTSCAKAEDSSTATSSNDADVTK